MRTRGELGGMVTDDGFAWVRIQVQLLLVAAEAQAHVHLAGLGAIDHGHRVWTVRDDPFNDD